MNEENKIGYYAIIPATVLFNEKIKANEKLLYAIITVLSNKYLLKKKIIFLFLERGFFFLCNAMK